MSARILVTGASGFIGRPLVAALAASGARVRAASRDPRAVHFPPEVESIGVSDYRGPVDWAPLLSGIDCVVHLAGIAHTGRAASTADYERVVHRAAAALATACAKSGVRRLVFLSSVRAQSGPMAERVLDEDCEPQPSDDYGRAKLAAEAAVRAADLDWTILRPVLVYGAGAKGNLGELLRLADTPWPLPLAGFSGRRSLVGIDNLTAAVLHALRTPATARQTYLLADAQPVTLPQIVAALRRGLGRPARLYALPPALFQVGLRLIGKEDVWQRLAGSLVVDPGRLMATGWHPGGDTLSGLENLAAAMRTRT